MGIVPIRMSEAAPTYALPPREELIELRRPAPISFVPRGRALFWQGEQQAHKIEIVDGVVRTVRVLENGNRQILAFYWPGDAVMPSQPSCQHFTAEAVTNCRVQRHSVSAICQQDELCGARQALAGALCLLVTMSQRNSIARVAEFLLRIRRHLPEDPKRPLALRLLIPRADIADHLGTSLETVCRTLADFKAKKLIEMPNRKTIRFLDPTGLRRIAYE